MTTIINNCSQGIKGSFKIYFHLDNGVLLCSSQQHFTKKHQTESEGHITSNQSAFPSVYAKCMYTSMLQSCVL